MGFRTTEPSPSAMPLGPIERAFARARAARIPSPSPPSDANESTVPSPDPTTLSESAPCSSTRQVHHVSTLAVRRSVLTWMVSNEVSEGEKGVVARALKQFPEAFPGSYQSNYMKALRWWRNRSEYLQLREGRARPGNLSSYAQQGVRRVNFKAVKGRGRKRAEWVNDLYRDLLSEFERVKALGVKTSPSLLRSMALALIEKAAADVSYHGATVFDGVPIRNKITYRWIQIFMQKHDLVIRQQTGKLSVSPEKKAQIEKSIAMHLGIMKRAFDSGDLDEDMVENADETHFVFNLDNGRTIGTRGDQHVKYADIVAGDEGITMMVRIRGGRDARIECPMLIFQNQNRSYPIRNVPDNVPGVC